jgi:endonuclease I
MKKILLSTLLFWGMVSLAQDGSPAMPYYSGVNFSQTGTALKNTLATHLTNKHVTNLTYAQIWGALQVVDADPSNSNNVLLIYGWENGSDSNVTNDRSRDKFNNGGDNGQWNREHTFAQGLGNPSLGQTGPGADAHHLRASDVQRNNDRGSLRFDAGSGVASYTTSNSGWYPGDEWKGDVARMILYMYLRYGNQCRPTYCAMGSTIDSDSNVPLLLLQWNAEDPVSPFEDFRNTYLANTSNTYAQGNRNPFIDNPYLATLIWGGPVAQNRWPFLSTNSMDVLADLAVYPNPAQDKVYIDTNAELESIELININGQLIQQIRKPSPMGRTYTIENLPKGFYIMKINTDAQSESRKVIVN